MKLHFCRYVNEARTLYFCRSTSQSYIDKVHTIAKASSAFCRGLWLVAMLHQLNHEDGLVVDLKSYSVLLGTERGGGSTKRSLEESSSSSSILDMSQSRRPQERPRTSWRDSNYWT